MRKFISKITMVFLSAFLILSFGACNDSTSIIYPKNGEIEIVAVEKDIYLPVEGTEKISVAHYKNMSEILLIEIDYAVEKLINDFVLGSSQSACVEIEETDTKAKLTRDNGEYCEIDFIKDTIYFSDFDRFNVTPYSDNPHDLLSFNYKNEEGEDIFIKRENSFFTPGYGILIDLAERNIPLDIFEKKKYIPLQTFNDLFVSSYGFNLAYNGKDIFVLQGSTISPDLMEIYYHEEKTERSDALAEFNYNELCLYLDLYYGLQDEHGFNNGFTYYLEEIGLKEKFLKNDAINSFNALGTLTMGYIADSHSSVVGASPYLGEAQPSEGVEINLAPGIIAQIENMQKFQLARTEQLGEVKFYEKVGNTAYVTFDEFTLEDRSGGYNEEALQIPDTLTIIMLAHAQISQDEEIENVVIDLSCNGGGAVDSAVYLVAWMLGSCDFSVYDSVTQSKAITSYSVDVNMDGKFDSEDTITDKNLYCIVSPVSFSCGNYAPALLKASGEVTIVGKTSSGGGCVVRQAVTADGTLFNISDARQMSIVKNGTYYSVDEGVAPDVVLTKVESFYNRVELTEYLNSLK